jgi:deoxyribonucleoside regulator
VTLYFHECAQYYSTYVNLVLRYNSVEGSLRQSRKTSVYDEDLRAAYLARIASLYYDERKTQQEVADEVGVTRSAVSRLIAEAHDRGLVEIHVRYPWTSQRLEAALMDAFPLKAARVLVHQHTVYEHMLRDLGVIAARYLTDIMSDGTTIGISWGTALFQMINALPVRHLPHAEVVQLIGATGTETVPTDGPILAHLLAHKLQCQCRYLHAPLIVDNPALRDALLHERTIRETIDRARRADIALVGIGSTSADLNSLLRAGYVTREDIAAIQSAGGVGDICAQHYTISGEWLDIEINRRAVGINLTDLAAIGTVIGVAGDARKSKAILGALRGGHIDVLVTDHLAAREVLALRGKHSLDGR